MHYVENSHDTNDRFNWVDEDLFNFFKNGHKNRLFENTAIFLYSDHGARFNDKHSSHDRYLEERMPFFSVYLPEAFKIHNPQKLINLKENINYLVSPFDIYASVRDLTNLEPLINKEINIGIQRSISLLDRISPKRNCENIGISDHYCICIKNWNQESITSIEIIKAVEYSIQIINKLTESIRNLCLKLNLTEIFSAESLIKDGLKLYRIQFKTYPNKGVYETLSYSGFRDDFEFKSKEFSIKSRNDISRIDAYGEQPYCVSNFKNNPFFILDLRKFCYCQPKRTIKISGNLRKF